MMSVLKNSGFKLILLSMTIAFLAVSCKDKCEEDCATFANFKMCDTKPDKEGCNDDLNVFAQDADYLTVSVEITDGEPTDELTATYFVKSQGAFVEFFTQSTALRDLDGIAGDESKINAASGISRKATELWPVAEYKVEIELSQEIIPLNETRNFTVE